MNTGTSRINMENKIKKRLHTFGDSTLGRFQQGSNIIKVVQAGALPVVDTGLGSIYHGENK